MNTKSLFINFLGWIFGILFSLVGIVNMFWGNDPLFGVFVFGSSLMFYPPLSMLFKKLSGYSIPGLVKILVGAFIIWASVGVGELFDKLDMMLASLS